MDQAIDSWPILALPQTSLGHHLQDAPERPAHARSTRWSVGVVDLLRRCPLPSKRSARRPPGKSDTRRQALVLRASAHRLDRPPSVRDTSRPGPYTVPSKSPSTVFRSRFKIQPTADFLARFFKQLLIQRENADTKHLDASLSVIHLLLKRLDKGL